MTRSPIASSNAQHYAMTAALAAALCILAAAEPARAQYVRQDARISGRQIHAFTDNSQNVTVVLGDFRLSLGQYELTGRDAVLWISDRQVGAATRRDIQVYVEGNARMRQADGEVITGQSLFVEVFHEGRLTATGNLSNRPLVDFPLHNRAAEARKAARQTDAPAAPVETPTQPAAPDAPPAATTQPPATAEPSEQAPAAPPAEAPAAEIQPQQPPPPVVFSTDSFTSREVEPRRRQTIARGNVYIAQGDPDSDLFLEMRAQAAVVFSEQRAEPIEGETVPYLPRLEGFEVPGGEGMREYVTGVYLEGDIILSRGDRVIRAPAVFYDFTTDRAIIDSPVFRTIQEQRDIPIYIRADEARILSQREILFRNAKVTSSEFQTPSYHIGAGEARFENLTPYDETGEALSPPRYQARFVNTTYNVGGVPILYWPYSVTTFEQGHTALRKVGIGRHGQLGGGIETEWHLFRLLGLIPPEGYKGLVELNWYERGPMAGTRLWYSRRDYSGYNMLYGLVDNEQEDDFGRRRENIPAPEHRGRILARHKHLLPGDWLAQFELSYVCDRNFLEEFFRNEFYAGKEQETLAYFRRQQDNWVVTALLEYRLYRFDSQAESAPDIAFHWIGEPLLQDTLTFFHESRLGAKRWHSDEDIGDDSDIFARADTRNELNLPLRLGAVNVVPYVTGRATYWGDTPVGGDVCRPYGQVGLRASTDIWRVYNKPRNRILDINRLKHVITPEAGVFFSDAGGVQPNELYPMDPDIEEHIRRENGLYAALRQRLQTKRGPAGNQRSVDWMRLDVTLGVFDNGPDYTTADGRFFLYRPEYSLGRNFVNADYLWAISDTTTLLADANYDMDTGQIGRSSAGLVVRRDPRLSYYLGMRQVRDLDSTVGTAGFEYEISRKYSISVFEQYDFDYRSGNNLATSITLTRRWPRWISAITFVYDSRENDYGVFLNIWPEGAPEARIGSGRMSLFGRSSMN